MQFVANIVSHLKKALVESDESIFDDENMSKFEEILDRVTGPDRTEPNYDEIFELVNMVNDDKVNSHDAVQLITDRLFTETHSSKYIALKVLEAIFYQCGNLVQREICTERYMGLLKSLLKNEEDESIRHEILKILVAWAEVFKHFPMYSAPEDLLKELLADGIDLSLFLKAEMHTRLLSKKVDPRSCMVKLIEDIKKLSQDSHPTSQPKDEDIEMCNVTDKGNGDTSMNDIEEVRLRRKKQHKMYLKLRGLATSSDEEDNKTNVPINQCHSEKSNEHNSDMKNVLTESMKKLMKQRENLNSSSQATQYKQVDSHLRSGNLCSAKNESSNNTNANSSDDVHKKTSNSIQGASLKRLPKELEDKKKQRIFNDNAISTYRLAKNEEYRNESFGNVHTEQCSPSDCDYCKRIKEMNYNKEHQNIFVTKQLPKEMQKVKESKVLLKNSFQEIQEMKKKTYYESKSNSRSNYDDLMNKNLTPKEMEEENIRKALIISRFVHEGNNEASNQLPTRGDIEEQRLLEQTLERSCIDNGNHQTSDFSDDEDFKKAINESVPESEAKFHSAHDSQEPKDDLQPQSTFQMNLSEANDVPEINKEQSNWANCLSCMDYGHLEIFRPCNHRCICKKCALKYPNVSCLICEK